MRSIKKGVDRVNHILETTDSAVTEVAHTTRKATDGVTNLMSKAGLKTVKKVIYAVKNTGSKDK